MDFPVEATVHIDRFQDEREVRRLLQSYGFKVTDLGPGRVQVAGLFHNLEAVKAHLERLTEATPRSSSDLPSASSGAISKHSRNNADPGSTQRRSASLGPRTSSGPKHQAPDYRTPGAVIMIDSDVYMYAKRFRKQQLDDLLTRQDVQHEVKAEEENTIINLQGPDSGSVSRNLQLLLEGLRRTLRTQEVLLSDLSAEGKRLLGRIRENNNSLNSVLVFEKNDRLHLVGPSKESYDLKQSLQGGPVDQSGARGQPADRPRRERSRSVPTRSQRSPAADGEVSSWRGGGQEAPRGRSLSESRAKREEEKLGRKDNHVQTAEGRNRGGIIQSLRKTVAGLFKKKKKKDK
ncbi:uncharacterized protein LOC106951942 [Poecilia latipinna]|uniref:RNA-binding protein 43 n=1 Tax=Poecilia formosa TaxID=48698 RepID=UPI000443AA8B|nr:PREDICTED: uncharacterized protein LOC103143472 [Poecilia formosa]XP_014895221.1 PREDICTED: uncharacterized protein LOC106951942 [Poecilia latipinna]